MVWDGPRPVLEGMLGQISVYADQVNFKSKGATARIQARYSGPRAGITEVPSETVELDTASTPISIYSAPRYAGLGTEIIKVVKVAVENSNPYKLDYGDIEEAINLKYGAASPSKGPKLALALELYTYAVHGQDSFFFPVHTVTRTRTVSRRYSTKIDQADVNKVFTTQQLSTLLGTQLLFAVPSLVLTAEEANIGLQVGWRKSLLRVNDAANRQRQMVETWELAKWTLVYKAK